MNRLLGIVGLAVLLFAAGGGVWAWDRHGPVEVSLMWPIPKLALPDSLAMQRDRALAQLADAQARAATVEAAVAKARPAAARHQAKADRIAVYTPKGGDVCAKLVDLDRELGE